MADRSSEADRLVFDADRSVSFFDERGGGAAAKILRRSKVLPRERALPFGFALGVPRELPSERALPLCFDFDLGVLPRKRALPFDLDESERSFRTFPIARFRTRVSVHLERSPPLSLGRDFVDGPVRPSDRIPIRPNGRIPVRPNDRIPVRPNDRIPVRPNDRIPVRPNDRIPVRPNGRVPVRPNDRVPVRPNGRVLVRLQH
ncbi:hypothetical protein LR48_Vigan01g050500 [Vigna angularis]|uniref:Uncharacterized protein n=1 Tax=Phaseolus angularis TaxID=3914 RepID=A0A0L9TK87_PHAAN|nr:hypothetical protein LR48_Vigan01g050500 [Vigna angularis]